MKVTIPSTTLHDGNPLHLVELEISDFCPACGGARGEVYKAMSYDGSRRLICDGWTNPCGHIDKYSDVRQEALITLEEK